MNRPLVTIGIPVRNCEKTIEAALDSVVSQDYPHDLMKIVLVDDGCADQTVHIANMILAESKIAFVILSTGGRGLGSARQTIVDNAEGKYILWVDGDSMLPRDYASKQVRYMELHPSIGKARGRWVSLVTKGLVVKLYSIDRLIASRHKQPEITGIGCSICRLDAIREAGGFDTNIKGAFEDIDLAMRMLELGWKSSSSDAVFYDRPKDSWKDFFKRYFWYGYGGHYLGHKYQKNFGEALLLPVATARGVVRAVEAYKYTHQKTSLLLPLIYIVGSIAWWLGYAEAHADKYFPRA